jgi:hypothetical protein
MANILDKTSILLILVCFMFSNQLSGIVWTAGKGLVYIVIFIYCIGFINESFALQIKKMITDIINIGSNNFIKDTLSTVAEGAKNTIKSIPNIYSSNETNIYKTNQTTNKNLYGT